jgi:hypothetical protein
MAVFGIPRTHENDALRAVRAAAELQRPELRIGVNTGEVVSGEGETIVTGDAVNVAARLEQAAGPGEVLIGIETFRLVRDAVGSRRCLRSTSGGQPSPPTACRDHTAADGHVARLAARRPPAQRERLSADFEHVVTERMQLSSARPAGVGKSRLVLDPRRVCRRALSAPAASLRRGITYCRSSRSCSSSELTLLGLGSSPETQLRSPPAGSAAAEQPLVVVLDDLQWAEETFLDVAEHVADWSRNAIFPLRVARPELLDARPMGRRRRTPRRSCRAAAAGDADEPSTICSTGDPRRRRPPAHLRRRTEIRCSSRRWSRWCARRAAWR